jgi:hypothetical protein
MKIQSKQTGGIVLYALFASIVFIVILHFVIRDNSSLIPVLVIIPIMIIASLFFYQIVVEADEKEVRFSLGIGWFKKSYPIDSIESCTVVRNKWWYGWGIRFFPGGTLYNVSGLKAIELKFKGKKAVVRIGTNRPEELSRFISKRLNNEK